MSHAALTPPMHSALPARRVALVWLSAAALSLSLVSVLAFPVRAATITVTTTTDELITSGNCSLREAIIAANTNAAVDGCQAGQASPTVDVISLPAGTYTLAIAAPAVPTTGFELGTDINPLVADLDVTEDLTISGAGARTTIVDGGDISRVFHVSGQSNELFAVSGITIRNGLQDAAGPLNPFENGGGIYNAQDADVTLTDVTVADNVAECHGGGVASSFGSLTVVRSTFSGNTAGQCADSGGANEPGLGEGGAIQAGGTEISNSTFSGNTANGMGGAIFSDGATIENSTFSGNTAQAGSGAVHAINGDADLKNTLLVANTPANCAATSGSIVSNGNNLGSDASCSLTAAGDLPSNGDSNLGTLQNNGGPTDTHALLAGSDAIDAGSGDCPPPATDQRGVARAQDGDESGSAFCDIGAYEAVPVPPTASINDVNAIEGSAGTTAGATFTVTLSRAPAFQVTMAWATANGTATAPADYLAANGTLTFAPGDTSETISITVVGDGTDELDETFLVNLSAPVNATLATARGNGTILDDDGAPPAAASASPSTVASASPTPTPAIGQIPDTRVAEGPGVDAGGIVLAILVLAVTALLSISARRRQALSTR